MIWRAFWTGFALISSAGVVIYAWARDGWRLTGLIVITLIAIYLAVTKMEVS